MKLRGLLSAAVVLVALAGLVYWSNKAEKAKENEPDPDAPPKIIDIEKDTIVRLELQQDGKATLVLEKGDDGNWKITTPQPLQADETSVGSLLTTVAGLTSNRLIEENATDLTTFGLDTPKLVVSVKQKDGSEIKLLVGDETPTGSNFFTKLDGDPRVFTLASWNKTSLEKSPWDLRDKRLLTFESEKLSRVELTAKGSTVEFGKNAEGAWQIVKPRPLRADGGSIEQLVGRLRDAKMDTEMSDEDTRKARATFARAKRVALVKVTDAAGTQELEVRKSSKDEYYAKSSILDGIYKVTSTLGEGLDKGLDDLRNKKLFDFGFNELTRLEIRDGDNTAVYEKKDGKWMKDGTQMDASSVNAFIDELRDLKADSFPDSGFTEPYFEVSVLTADGKQEKVLVSKTDDNFYAKRDGEPSIYKLKPVDADRVQALAQDIKEPTEEADTSGETDKQEE